MNNLYQVTVVEFCLFLSEKFMDGKKFEQVDWDAVNDRLERQNLTVREEKQAREYVSAQRTALREADFAEKKAQAVIERAMNGVVLRNSLKLETV